MDDAERMIRLKELLAGPCPPDPLDEFAKIAWPELWLSWTPARALRYLRLRLNWSQADVARRAGLSPSAISELESGKDAKMSTWRRVYDAMGLTLVLAPRVTASPDELRRFADLASSRTWGSRARPRRR